MVLLFEILNIGDIVNMCDAKPILYTLEGIFNEEDRQVCAYNMQGIEFWDLNPALSVFEEIEQPSSYKYVSGTEAQFSKLSEFSKKVQAVNYRRRL